MDEDRDPSAPSLEPPSLFGRKRRKASRPPAEPTEPTEPAAPPAPADRPAPVAQVAQVDTVDTDTIFDDTSEPTPAPVPTGSPLTPPPAPEPSREPRAPREPWLSGRLAAAVTGLVAGGLIVGATAGSLRICTEVKGTSSCGDQGFFLLVAILAVAVLVGTVLLRVSHVAEPGSTSFLAVGLLSVATLLFLIGSIFQWWMVIVIPLVSVASFLLSHWVTSNFVDPANDGSDPAVEPERHDVR